MKNILTGSLATTALLLFATPALAGPHWFETDHFKAKHADWSAKFVDLHGKLKAAQADNKKAHDALKAEKDKAKRADLVKATAGPKKAAWDAETAWLKLHQEWKKLEVERNNKDWDERIVKIKAAMETNKVAPDLKSARADLWKAEIAWIEANRVWRKLESEYHQKKWAERLQKIADALAKAK